MTEILVIYLAVVNIVSFICYGIDKSKARRHKWRIPEATLIGLAAIGGGLGSWIGMKTFRHKTQHWKFRILVPLFLIAWIAGVGYLCYINLI